MPITSISPTRKLMKRSLEYQSHRLPLNLIIIQASSSVTVNIIIIQKQRSLKCKSRVLNFRFLLGFSWIAFFFFSIEKPLNFQTQPLLRLCLEWNLHRNRKSLRTSHQKIARNLIFVARIKKWTQKLPTLLVLQW